MLKIQQLVDQYIYDTQDTSFRYHLGPSTLGIDCERQVWYSWRWFAEKREQPDKVRLLSRGHREEEIVLSYLLAVGIKVFQTNPETGKQYQFEALGGHLGGSLDAILQGVPDLNGLPCLFECKTASAKNFAKLAKAGTLRAVKVDHYVQTQLYMRAYDLLWTLYVCVCKDTDEWHWELIGYDALFAENYMQRGANIIASTRPPLKLSNDPGYFICKWCDYKEQCHFDAAPAMNCRTCVHSVPKSDGRWHCELLPTYKIRTKEEAEQRGKSLVHMPCSGSRYEAIK